MQRFPMTVGGHAALEAELKQLKNVERGEIIQAIAVAREHGDLKENAEYHAAKEKQGFIEGRIQELESKLSLAQIIDVTKMSGETVKFGAKVKLVNVDTDAEMTYQIVGEDEAGHQKRRPIRQIPGRASICAQIRAGRLRFGSALP